MKKLESIRRLLKRAAFDPTARRAVVALAIRVGSAIVAYAAQIALARWLGVEQYGMYAAIWAWLLIAGATAPLGLNVLVIGQLPARLVEGDVPRWRGLMLTTTAVSLSVSAGLAGMGLLVLTLFPGLVAQAYLVPVWLALFCLPLIALAESNEGIARAHGWVNTALVPPAIVRPLLLLGSGAAVWASGYQLDTATIVLCAIFACALSAIPQAMWLLVRLQKRHGGRDCVWSKGWLLAALPIMVAELCELVFQSLDLFFVAAWLGSEEAGLYFAAQRSAMLILFINFAVGAATADRISEIAATGHKQALAHEVRLAATMTFWPTVLAAGGLILMSPILLALFGPDFAAGAGLVPILAAGFVLRALVGPAEILLPILGAERANAWLVAGVLVLAVGFNAALIPWLGLQGAAIASACGYAMLGAGIYVVGRRKLGLDFRPYLMWPHGQQAQGLPQT